LNYHVVTERNAIGHEHLMAGTSFPTLSVCGVESLQTRSSFTPDLARRGTSRHRIRHRFHTGIFHTHCTALRHRTAPRDAPWRTGSGVKVP